MSEHVVAVDVGNSAAKVCLAQSSDLGQLNASDASSSAADEPASLLDEMSVRLEQEDWHRSIIAWVDSRTQNEVSWRVASVHDRAGKELRAVVETAGRETEVQLVSRTDVPMKVHVDHPDRLGIDRLVGAYAAANRYGGPIVVIDAGSAITVDWVDAEGAFGGGAILPGLTMQVAALASGTDALPKIDFHSDAPLVAPAKNTVDAIRLGVMMGSAASIERLAVAYCDAAGLDSSAVRWVVTGGDSRSIAPMLRRECHQIDNLVCRGLLDLARF